MTPRTLLLLRVAALLVVAAVVAVVVGHLARGDLYWTGPAWSLVVVVAVVVAATEVLRWYLTTRTRTRLAETEQVVSARATDERRRFMLRLDHEMKNPVTAMRADLANLGAGLAGLGTPDAGVPPAVAGAMTSVTSQALRLSRLTADLRKIAELETQELTLGPVDLGEVLAEVVGSVDGDGVAERISLVVPKAPRPLPAAWADQDLIFLALFNLVANAVKFSGPQDPVEIRCTDEHPWVGVQVADTGLGIPADEIDSVWDELSRSRNARGLPGTGLGLPLVRTIIARHGGTIELSSVEGEGTVISLRLPVGPEPLTQLNPATAGGTLRAALGRST